MKNHIVLKAALVLLLLLATIAFSQKQENMTDPPSKENNIIILPEPMTDGKVSLEKALMGRRSIRNFSSDSLTIFEISQILWSAQGITKKIKEPSSGWRGDKWPGGLRTAPSAGALYPIELYIATARVTGLPQGLYKYIPQEHTITRVLDGDKRMDISDAALKQKSIQNASAVIIIFGVIDRTTAKYGDRAPRYVNIECGAVCQNIYLQSYTLNLGAVFAGAFNDEKLKSVLNVPENEYPLGIMPLGKKSEEK